MAKIKMAQKVGFFLCEYCAAVHIGFWRNGVMFAEAIPNDIDAVATDLAEKIEMSRALANSSSKH